MSMKWVCFVQYVKIRYVASTGDESFNGSNAKPLSVGVIGNCHVVKPGLEASSDVGSGRNQVVNEIESCEKSEAV